MIRTESSHTLSLEEAVGKEMAEVVRASRAAATRGLELKRRLEMVISHLENAAEDIEDDIEGGMAHANIGFGLLKQIMAEA